MFATGETVVLAEWIIDDPCLFVIICDDRLGEKKMLNGDSKQLAELFYLFKSNCLMHDNM